MSVEMKKFLEQGIAQIPLSHDIRPQLVQLGFHGPADIVLFAYYGRMPFEELLGVHWAELQSMHTEFKKAGINLVYPYSRSLRLDIIDECKKIFMGDGIDYLMGDDVLTRMFSQHHITTVGDYVDFVNKHPKEYMDMKHTNARQIARLNMWLHEFGFDIDNGGWRDN